MSIIRKPVLTEKYTAMNAAGKYTFIVDPKANKIEIAKEIKKMYGVEVASVNTLKQTSGLTQTTKRAIVTVAKGEIIDFYQGL
jgi:large subunit ribosomal protein L23